MQSAAASYHSGSVQRHIHNYQSNQRSDERHVFITQKASRTHRTREAGFIARETFGEDLYAALSTQTHRMAEPLHI